MANESLIFGGLQSTAPVFGGQSFLDDLRKRGLIQTSTGAIRPLTGQELAAGAGGIPGLPPQPLKLTGQTQNLFGAQNTGGTTSRGEGLPSLTPAQFQPAQVSTLSRTREARIASGSLTPGSQEDLILQGQIRAQTQGTPTGRTTDRDPINFLREAGTLPFDQPGGPTFTTPQGGTASRRAGAPELNIPQPGGGTRTIAAQPGLDREAFGNLTVARNLSAGTPGALDQLRNLIIRDAGKGALDSRTLFNAQSAAGAAFDQIKDPLTLILSQLTTPQAPAPRTTAAVDPGSLGAAFGAGLGSIGGVQDIQQRIVA